MTDLTYLERPRAGMRCTVGTVWHSGGRYEIEAEPDVLQLAKRVFPGCRGRGDRISFAASPRIFGDLVWLMQRYPMRIECEKQFERDRVRAIEHAMRRESAVKIEPVMDPASFRGSLAPFQGDGVAFLLANRRAILADDMGLGKTVQALAALGEAEAWPAVVVCPAGQVVKQWGRMAEAFLEFRNPGEFIEAPALCHAIRGLRPYELPEVPIYLVHYGLIRAWWTQLADLQPRAVIFDEIQELRRTETMKYSAASHLSDAATWCWGLSGTPIYNLGGEIWAVLNAVERNCLGDYGSFSREWCDGYGAMTIRKPAELGAYLRREGLMLRRRTAEVQSQIPKVRSIPIFIDHDEDVYAKLIRRAVELSRQYEAIRDFHEKGQTKREIDTASRQATGIAKADAAGQWIRALVDAGEKPLVFAYHHAVHDILASHFEPEEWVRISGRESPKEKDASVRSFAAGEASVVMLSLRTSAGLDGLQGRATCIVFAELDWSPAIHKQCATRLARMGVNEALTSVRSYYLLSATGFDQVMQDALGLKVGQFVGLMGDEAETEEDKALAASEGRKHLDQVIERLKAA